MSADHLLVEDPGLFTTVQDLGRTGYQRFGISPAGAMDPDRLALANALAGNAPDLAGLEMTAAGPTLVVEAEACRIAVAGDQAITVNGEAAGTWRAVDLKRGDRVQAGALRAGLRGYLAVAGGFALAPTLGSLSTHTRTGIGGLDGRALRRGDRLPLRPGRAAGPPLALDPPPAADSAGAVRVVLGPQSDAFTEAGLATFLTSGYTVSARSDRMGCQLDGPGIEHRGGFNIVSDGIVGGSIQVPGSGRPIVLLADRQTTGGYTKIATVISADLPLFAQLRPGDTVRFRAVTLDEADRAAVLRRERLAALVGRLAPARVTGRLPEAGELLALNLVGGMVSATADPFAGDAPVSILPRDAP